MGFFNFSKPAASNSDNGDTSSNSGGESTAPQQDIILMFNDESVTISASEAEGKTVSQLFDEFGGDMGDVDRINRFVASGHIVSGTSAAQPGIVYRGAVTSESKGNN